MFTSFQGAVVFWGFERKRLFTLVELLSSHQRGGAIAHKRSIRVRGAGFLNLFLFLGPVALCADVHSQLEVQHHLPEMSSVFPQGWQRGKTLRVKVLGEYLDQAEATVFGDSSIRGRILGSRHTEVDLEFEISPQASYGLHYFRIVSPRGASNLLPFRVGDLPHRLEHEPNNSFEQAEDITFPVTINGRMDIPGDFGFYRFRAEKGQTLVFDLRATRLGNALDAGLILLDSRRRKLAHSEDYFNSDPFFTYAFQETGSYYLIVQPTGDKLLDPNFAYQLDVRTTPELLTISPLSFAPGAETEATIFVVGDTQCAPTLSFEDPGFQGEILGLQGSKIRVKIQPPAEAQVGEHRLALATAGGRSNSILFLVDSTRQLRNGNWIEPPVSVNGIAHYPEAESFFFEANANETLDFEVRAHRYGSPVDSYLLLVNQKGEQLAENDDAKIPGLSFNRDSEIVYTFKERGKYELRIRNLWALDGDGYPYNLVARPVKPGAELSLDSDRPYVEAGGEGTIKVSAARKGGFDGPIKLNVTGLPPGVIADQAELPAKATEASIRFHTKDAKPGTCAPIRITSRQADAPAGIYVRVPQDGVEASVFRWVDSPLLTVAEKPRYSVEVAVNDVNLVPGGSSEIPIQIRRAKDFKEEIHFKFENLLPGVSPEEAFAPRESEVGKIRLTARSDAIPARSAHVVLIGTTNDGHAEEAPQITLSVQ